MNKIKLILAILFTAFLFSCSGPVSFYNFDTPLSNELASSQTTELKVNIPKGWFTAEDNKDNKIDLWLVEENYSAAISFIRIHIDEEIKKSKTENSLNKVKEFSLLNNKLAHRNNFIDLLKTESFEINGREFSAYQFAGSNYRYRVVVYGYKGNYYECVAAIKPGLTEADLIKIYSIQNSVLASIK